MAIPRRVECFDFIETAFDLASGRGIAGYKEFRADGPQFLYQVMFEIGSDVVPPAQKGIDISAFGRFQQVAGQAVDPVATRQQDLGAEHVTAIFSKGETKGAARLLDYSSVRRVSIWRTRRAFLPSGSIDCMQRHVEVGAGFEQPKAIEFAQALAQPIVQKSNAPGTACGIEALQVGARVTDLIQQFALVYYKRQFLRPKEMIFVWIDFRQSSGLDGLYIE